MRESILVTMMLFVLALPAAAAEPPEVGLLTSGDVQFAGKELSAGSTILGNGLLATRGAGARLRLPDGRELEISRNTVLKLVSRFDDTIEVTVLSGTVALEDRKGERLTAGEKSRFVIRPLRD